MRHHPQQDAAMYSNTMLHTMPYTMLYIMLHIMLYTILYTMRHTMLYTMLYTTRHAMYYTLAGRKHSFTPDSSSTKMSAAIFRYSDIWGSLE